MAVLCCPIASNAQVRFSFAEKSDFEWSDLKGSTDTQSPYAASVNTGISYSYVTDHDGVLVKDKSEVTAYLYPKLSWFKPKQTSDRVLRHERTHFAISELHARMLRKGLAELPNSKTAKADVKKIYSEVENSRKSMQKLFDAETQHSLLMEEELAWEQKISEQLLNLKRWDKS